LNFYVKHIAIFFITLSASNLANCQVKEEKVYIANFYSAYSENFASSKATGSKHVNLYINNLKNSFDTIEIKFAGQNIQLRLKPLADTLLSLPNDIGMLQSVFTGKLISPYSAIDANSAFYGNKYNNELVWVKKSKTTEVVLRDSSYSLRLIENGYNSYYVSTTMHGFSPTVFGNTFILNTWDSHVFTIVAQKDSTPIDITFKRKHYDTGILRTYPKERFYLNKGQALEYYCWTSSLTGTLIEAPHPCKPIVVFYPTGGGTKDGFYLYNNQNNEYGMGCNELSSSYCRRFGQDFHSGGPWKRHASYNYAFLPPQENAGYQYIVPSKIKGTVNLVEVQALYDNTDVYFDGNLERSLKKGEFYLTPIKELTLLTANEPINVQYFSKFQSYQDYLILEVGPLPNYANRWVRQPVMAMEEGKTEYQVYIPYSNNKNMVNVECVLQKGDTLFNGQGIAIVPTYRHSKGNLECISFALDSGWHTINSSHKFLTWVYYYFYETSVAKNGSSNIFIDSSFDKALHTIKYIKIISANLSGEMLGYNPKRYAQSVRVNEVLNRTLGVDSFYTVCQQSPVKLWGRADFYKAKKSYWVIDNKDTLLGTQHTHQFEDTGFYRLTFFTERMDSLCDGTFGTYIDSTQIGIKVYYKPKVYLPNDTLVCKGSTLTITAVSEKDTALSWFAGGAFISNGINSISIKADTALSIITSITHLGCSASKDTMLINLFDSIALRLPKDTLLCYGQYLNVKPTLSGGDSNSYYFNWQNDSTSLTTKYTVTKDTLVVLKVSDQCVDVNSNRDSMLIMARQPIVTLLQSNSNSCNGQLTKVVAHSTGGIKPLLYNWNNTVFTADSTFTYLKKDSFILSCIISDNCSKNDTQTIVLKPHLETLVTHFKVDSVFCENQLFNLLVKTNGSVKDSTRVILTSPTGKTNILKGTIDFNINLIPEKGKWTFSLSNNCTNTIWDTTFNIAFPLHNFAYKSIDTVCQQGININYTFTSSQSSKHQYMINLNGTSNFTFLQNNGSVSFEIIPQLGLNNLFIGINDGCNFDSIVNNFTVYPAVKLQKQLDTAICQNDIFKLNAYLTQGNPKSTVSFQINGNRFDLNDKVSFTDDQILLVQALDECGNKDFDTFLVHVVKPIQTITISPLFGCTPLTIDGEIKGFTNEDTKGWWIKPNNNQTLIDANFNIILNDVGIHTFKWQTSSASGKTCSDTFIKVNVYPIPKINIKVNPTFPEVNLTEINLTTNAVVKQYYWYINDTFVSSSQSYDFRATWAGVHHIKLVGVSNEGCADSKVDKIEILNSNYAYIPNAFSPNNDGRNDLWTPVINNILSAELYIYDRWGGQIHHQNSQNLSWDGKYQDNAVQEGSYVYVIFIQTINNEKHQFSGQIMLLR